MNLSGNLFKAREKKGEKSPDMRGTCKDTDGNEYDIAAWSKESDKAGRFLSFKITDKYEPKSAPEPEPERPAEDLPF